MVFAANLWGDFLIISLSRRVEGTVKHEWLRSFVALVLLDKYVFGAVSMLWIYIYDIYNTITWGGALHFTHDHFSYFWTYFIVLFEHFMALTVHLSFLDYFYYFYYFCSMTFTYAINDYIRIKTGLSSISFTARWCALLREFTSFFPEWHFTYMRTSNQSKNFITET